MTSGIEYSFPGGTTLSAGEKILLVKNLAAFNAHYTTVSPGVRKFQWTDGSLSNDGEQLQLSKPGDKEWEKDRYWIRVDRVKYDDSEPWPTEPDNTSLDRIDDSAYGNDSVNWQSQAESPGI